MDQEASEGYGVKPFMAKVSSWKPGTIDLLGFVLNVTWSPDLLSNKYLHFRNFLQTDRSLLKHSRSFDDIINVSNIYFPI